MSEIRNIVIPRKTVKKLLYLSKKLQGLNTGNKSRNFWLVSQENSESYSWDAFDIGVNDSGELITVSQSGCSCNSYEFPQEADTKYKLEGEVVIPYEGYYSERFEQLDNLIEMTYTLYTLFKSGKFEVDKVLKLTNAEIRRAVIEHIGLEKFMKKANPKVLDESKWGKLLKIELPKDDWGGNTDEDIVAVLVKDTSTARNYFLRVPPEIKTAKSAIAWTFDIDDEFEFKEES